MYTVLQVIVLSNSVLRFMKSVSHVYKAVIESISDPTQIKFFAKSISRLYKAPSQRAAGENFAVFGIENTEF